MQDAGFIDQLKLDLKYPPEYGGLFDSIERAEELATVLANKDSLVKARIDSCGECFEGVSLEDLVDGGFVEKRDIEEIVVAKPFSLRGAFQSKKITIRGPVGFREGVVIGRSNIIGPAYLSEGSKIFDSLLRGGSSGSVYVGRDCTLWDYTVIIRSMIGDSSLIHTCNIDDSIIGPESNLGATRALSDLRILEKNRAKADHKTLLGQRIVLANYSYGNKIKILDPVTDSIVETDATHFGTLCGAGVWLASGTIVYPGTIIGSGARVNSPIPLIGYIGPDQTCSVFASMKKDEHGNQTMQLKGTLARQIEQQFTDSN